MFNRKYRELADAALKDRELAKKVIMENKTATLTETINFVDKMAMGLELFNTMFEEEPMDCSMVDKEKTATDKSDLEKKLEKQNKLVITTQYDVTQSE